MEHKAKIHKPKAQSPKPWMAPDMREIAKQSCGYCGEEYYHKNTCQTILYGKTKINKHGK